MSLIQSLLHTNISILKLNRLPEPTLRLHGLKIKEMFLRETGLVQFIAPHLVEKNTKIKLEFWGAV